MHASFSISPVAHVLNVSGLDQRYAGLVAQFLASNVEETDMSWGDAIEMALDAGQDIDFDETPLGRFLAQPVAGVSGFTWGQAIDESLSAGTVVDFGELPVARTLRTARKSVRGSRSTAEVTVYHGAKPVVMDVDPELALALELRRERLHFGGRRTH